MARFEVRNIRKECEEGSYQKSEKHVMYWKGRVDILCIFLKFYATHPE